MIFADGSREVAVWLYPNDPDLPGLARAASPAAVADLLNEHRALPQPVTPTRSLLETVGYRPRRRAVLRVIVRTPAGRVVFYVKVLREAAFAATLRRHELLIEAGLPAPPVAAATTDFVLVLRELSGRPLASAMFDSVPPCRAEDLVGLLDAMPTEISLLPRRAPWVDSVEQYAAMVAAALPELGARLASLTAAIRGGLAGRARRRADPRRLPRGSAAGDRRSRVGTAGRRHGRPGSTGGRPGLPRGTSVDRAADERQRRRPGCSVWCAPGCRSSTRGSIRSSFGCGPPE